MSSAPVPEDATVDGIAGEPIALPISPGPATGHRWYLDLPDGVHRIDDEPGREPDEQHGMGESLGGRLRVVAPAGDHVITATLARPWERPAAVRRVRIHLHVH